MLKVSAIEGDEPQTLAQLQHTNIVPIYSVHEDRDAGLRAVCMPYFGGACFARVLRRLWGNNTVPTTGAELVRALEGLEEGREKNPQAAPRQGRGAAAGSEGRVRPGPAGHGGHRLPGVHVHRPGTV
mgnify:CR=1 FL=1